MRPRGTHICTPPTMSPVSLDEFCRTLRRTHDINALQRLHYEVSRELTQRSSDSTTGANPRLRGATACQLMRLLNKVFDQMMVIVTTERANRNDIRYGIWNLGGRSGG